MDLHEHKKSILKRVTHQRSGFSLMVVPHYQGKTRKIKITPFKIYLAACLVGVIIVGFVSLFVAYRTNCNELAKLKGMNSESLTTAQSKELQLLQNELAKTKADLDALTQYVSSISQLEKQVRDSLKLGNSKVSLEYVLNRSTKKAEIQSFTDLPTSVAQLLNETTNTTELAQEKATLLTTLKEAADTYNMLLAQTPDIWPIYGTITSYFGWRQNPFGGSTFGFHTGIDIASYYGAPVRAAGEGEVVFAGWDGGYGKCVRIYHRDGIETVYAHFSEIAVKVGQKVKKGQVIGYEGCTGNCTGSHVHFEVRVGGVYIDPLDYLQ